MAEALLVVIEGAPRPAAKIREALIRQDLEPVDKAMADVGYNYKAAAVRRYYNQINLRKRARLAKEVH